MKQLTFRLFQAKAVRISISKPNCSTLAATKTVSTFPFPVILLSSFNNSTKQRNISQNPKQNKENLSEVQINK